MFFSDVSQLTLTQVSTIGYEVNGIFDDGIFEPGEEIEISGFSMTNDGGLTLPEGAQLFFPPSPTFMSDNTSYLFPSVPIGNVKMEMKV